MMALTTVKASELSPSRRSVRPGRAKCESRFDRISPASIANQRFAPGVWLG
jgi:hypothetical protein